MLRIPERVDRMQASAEGARRRGDTAAKTNLVLVHAHTIYREGLRYHFGQVPRYKIIGEASNGQQAIRLVDYSNPDIIVMDVDLPGVNGIEVARTVKLNHPNIGVILLSDINDQEGIVKSLRAGVAAYLSRTIDWDDLINSVDMVRSGNYPINDLVLNTPAVAAAVMDSFRQLTMDTHTEHVYSPMSPREIEVLELVAAGQTNKEIAARLEISNQTVKNHISSILRKLAVNDRTQAVVFALQRGWIKIVQNDNSFSGM